jgi:hypothetical protein
MASISSISYSSSSLYYNTPIDSQGRLSYLVPRPVPSAPSDKIVTISAVYNQRPDLLAHDLYGDSRLWWVFAQRNPNSLASDPLGNFVTGLQIYIPNANTLKTALGL